MSDELKSDECPECGGDLHEVSAPTDMDGETYKCENCGYRFRLHYDEMQ